MRFSIQLFGLRANEHESLVAKADALGFEAVWLADHVVTPVRFAKRYPYNPTGDPGYRPETPLTDVAVTLGYLAARTSQIKLATGVLVLPLRHPFLVARAWAALQQLSGGRAVLGVGAGWMEEEYDALDLPFAGRGGRMDEMLDILELLWAGGEASYDGDHFAFDPVHFGEPLEPRVPIVFGGHAEPSLRRAAQRGAGWFGPNVDLGESMAFRDRIEGLRAEHGRQNQPFDYFVRLYGDVNEANVRRYEDSGFQHLVFSPFPRLPPGATNADRLQALEQVADRLFSAWPP